MGNMIVGEGDATHCSFEVSGRSKLTVDGDMSVGEDDSTDDDASDSDGSAISASTLTIGDGITASGQVTVSTGATITIAGAVTVGAAGTGELSVLSGGTLTAGSTTIGGGTTGQGTVTIDGLGTTASLGDTTIGDQGNGTLNITGGATVNAGDVIVGNQSDSSGTLLLDGIGTSLKVSSLTVGESGQGTLLLSNGAVLTNNGDVIVADQISGVICSVNIATSSMLSINGNLTVGSGGVATMDIMTGGEAIAIGDVSIGDNPDSSGIVTIDGVQPTTGPTSGTPSSLFYGQKLTVGNFGMGTLNISAGGLVAPTPGGVGEVDIASQSNSTGAITVSGTDPKSGVSSQLIAGSLAIGGTMMTAGGMGSLNVNTGGKVQIITSLQMWSSGTIDVSGGGSVTVGSGASATDGEVQIDEGGTLGGGGTIIGTLVDAGGTIAPGDPMTLEITGDYVQTDGFLDLLVDGSDPGLYDHLDITGDLDLDGTVELDFGNGFAPSMGDIYDLISTGTTSDFNPTFDIEGLEPGWQYRLEQATDGDYEVVSLSNGVALPVPEPSSVALLCGIGLLLPRRRRRLMHSP